MVDDLRTRRRFAGEPRAAACDRLPAALTAASALRRAERDFVVAPVPARDGELLIRIGDFFAAAVYPLVGGRNLELDRLRWDPTEIALCLARLRAPHGRTADDDKTWSNLGESVVSVAVSRLGRRD